MLETQRSERISTKIRKIANVVERVRGEALTALAHHIDEDFLKEACRRTRKSGSPGVDGKTGADFCDRLDDNIRRLHAELKTGSYRAPPVRRVYIPKAGGERPLGIPTFEDKVLQRAVTMILEEIYEREFLSFSFGFRPGRSAHDALSATRNNLVSMQGGWVIDLDIKDFFGTLNHSHLNAFLDLRVKDGVIRRTINKWLKAGVFEHSAISRKQDGTPQGGVVSPILANVYMHYVLDVWFNDEVVKRMRGRAWLVRYADDCVFGFACEADARRVLDVLGKRLERYGLSMNIEKTRLVNFVRPPQHRNVPFGKVSVKPETFDFLGICHYWGVSRNGYNVVKVQTSRKSFRRGLEHIRIWCKTNRHLPVKEQHRFLSQKLVGHYRYFGITGNSDSIVRFRFRTRQIWRLWLNKRSQGNHMPWYRFVRLEERYSLPPAIAYRSTLRPTAKL